MLIPINIDNIRLVEEHETLREVLCNVKPGTLVHVEVNGTTYTFTAYKNSINNEVINFRLDNSDSNVTAYTVPGVMHFIHGNNPEYDEAVDVTIIEPSAQSDSSNETIDKENNMLIDFNDLAIPFHRLAPGAVLIGPDDTRYMKSVTEDWEYIWTNCYDWAIRSGLTEKQMESSINGDNGEGWKVIF